MDEIKFEIDEKGSKIYTLEGKHHRLDGPAIEYSDGSKLWFQNGQRHRIDGPACEYANGDRTWFVNGNLHREDGPAREWATTLEWWLDYNKYTEEDWKLEIEKRRNHKNKTICQECLISLI